MLMTESLVSMSVGLMSYSVVHRLVVVAVLSITVITDKIVIYHDY